MDGVTKCAVRMPPAQAVAGRNLHQSDAPLRRQRSGVTARHALQRRRKVLFRTVVRCDAVTVRGQGEHPLDEATCSPRPSSSVRAPVPLDHPPSAVRADRRAPDESRHAGGDGLLVDAALPQGVPLRPARHRDAASGCGGRSSTSSSCRPGPAGRDAITPSIWNNERNEGPLKTITRSQAEQLAARLKRRPATGSWSIGPCATASPMCRAARGPARQRLRPHPAGAALPAICRRDLGDRLRPGLSRADGHALAAGGARRAALPRRSRLYRCPRSLDEAANSRSSTSSRR